MFPFGTFNWNNDYPYTDFHELNLQPWIDEIAEIKVKIGNLDLTTVAQTITGAINELKASIKTYTAGSNIQISDSNVISATDTTYTAGSNVAISSSNVISATDTTYTAGANVSISSGNVISATDTTYTAGTNISIVDNVISATGGGGGASIAEATATISPSAWQQSTDQTYWYASAQVYIPDGYTSSNSRLIGWCVKNDLDTFFTSGDFTIINSGLEMKFTNMHAGIWNDTLSYIRLHLRCDVQPNISFTAKMQFAKIS